MVAMVEQRAAADQQYAVEMPVPKWYIGIWKYAFSMWPKLFCGNARERNWFRPIETITYSSNTTLSKRPDDHLATFWAVVEVAAVLAGTLYFTFSPGVLWTWVAMHVGWGAGVHMMDVQDYRRGSTAAQLKPSKLSLEELQDGVIELIRERMQKAHEKMFGDVSLFADRRAEITAEKHELIRQQEYFSQRVKAGEGEIAYPSLVKVQGLLEVLQVKWDYLAAAEEAIARTMATVEARLPRMRNMLADKMMVEALEGSATRVDGIVERVDNLVPEANQILFQEFGRLDLLITSATDKAMALPMPDLDGDDIKVIASRVVADQHVFASEMTSLEDSILGITPEPEMA